MRLFKIIILLFSLMLLQTAAKAHALWIETATSGKAGQAHQVKIFTGSLNSTTWNPLINGTPT